MHDRFQDGIWGFAGARETRSLSHRFLFRGIAELAAAEGLHKTTVRVVVKLSSLAPDLVEQILAGRQPRRLTLCWLQRHRLPVEWPAQRELIASFESEPGRG